MFDRLFFNECFQFMVSYYEGDAGLGGCHIWEQGGPAVYYGQFIEAKGDHGTAEPEFELRMLWVFQNISVSPFTSDWGWTDGSTGESTHCLLF